MAKPFGTECSLTLSKVCPDLRRNKHWNIIKLESWKLVPAYIMNLLMSVDLQMQYSSVLSSISWENTKRQMVFGRTLFVMILHAELYSFQKSSFCARRGRAGGVSVPGVTVWVVCSSVGADAHEILPLSPNQNYTSEYAGSVRFWLIFLWIKRIWSKARTFSCQIGMGFVRSRRRFLTLICFSLAKLLLFFRILLEGAVDFYKVQHSQFLQKACPAFFNSHRCRYG